MGLCLFMIIGTLWNSCNPRPITEPTKDLPIITDSIIIDSNFVIEEENIRWYSIDTVYIDDIYDEILDAIIHVESSGNDSAYRASEDAVGCLQIRKVMVDDVNRILKRQGATDDELYVYGDRWERGHSIQMFKIFCNHYGLEYPEEIARCWNGGPRGINNPNTLRYWKEVQEELGDYYQIDTTYTNV